MDLRRFLLVNQETVQAEKTALSHYTVRAKFLAIAGSRVEALQLFQKRVRDFASLEVIDSYRFFDYNLYIVSVISLQEDAKQVQKKLLPSLDIYALDGAITFLRRNRQHLDLYIKQLERERVLFTMFPDVPTELILWIQSHMAAPEMDKQRMYMATGAGGQRQCLLAANAQGVLHDLQKLYPDAVDWSQKQLAEQYWTITVIGEETDNGLQIHTQQR